MTYDFSFLCQNCEISFTDMFDMSILTERLHLAKDDIDYEDVEKISLLERDEGNSSCGFKVLNFDPYLGKRSNLTSIFNHQLELLDIYFSFDCRLYLGLSPFPVIVTTRKLTFVVGGSYINYHLPLLVAEDYTKHLQYIAFEFSWNQFVTHEFLTKQGVPLPSRSPRRLRR